MRRSNRLEYCSLSSKCQSPHSAEYLKTHAISLYAFILILLCWTTQSFAKSPLQLSVSTTTRALLSQGLDTNQVEQGKQFNHAMAMYERAEYFLARRLLLPLAQRQYTEAEFYMGMIFDMGLGVDKSPGDAVNWYLRAARKGNQHAQHNLAVAYAHGEGIQQDISKALEWWRRAARQGNTDSQYNLGIVYATGSQQVKRDLLKAEKWWRKAAINGDAMAQYNLGALYANGEKKVTSYCEAMRWWQESARSGIEQALEAIEILKQRDDYQPC